LRPLFEYRLVFAIATSHYNEKHSNKTLNVWTTTYVKSKTIHVFLARYERFRKKVESALHYVGVTLTVKIRSLSGAKHTTQPFFSNDLKKKLIVKTLPFYFCYFIHSDLKLGVFTNYSLLFLHLGPI